MKILILRTIAVIATFFALNPCNLLAAPQSSVVFVTQVPHPADFTTIGSTFGNQLASLDSVYRGGDLFIRYPDGSLKNLTAIAGFGSSGMQGANSIAVRDPAVHWDGNKILFSMVVGAPTQQYQVRAYYWQLYEVSGIGQNQTPVITKVSNQPENYNNVMPVYGTDDRIIFATDRPRNGDRALYPQRDEYESAPTNTGLWSLDPVTGDLKQLDHSPSGDFHPIVDSFGRVIFTRWDHLQRDQQAGGLSDYGAFNYSDESASAAKIESDVEVFPEPRSETERTRENSPATLNLHRINHFFPWQINEDGTEHETLNHIGRHELHSYFDRSFNDDDNLSEYLGSTQHKQNLNTIQNLFQIREDPLIPGLYYGIDCPEFSTHASGQIVTLNGPPTLSAEKMNVTYITHRDTAGYTNAPNGNHSGLYRNPLPMSDGSLVASHTSETREDANTGSGGVIGSRYDFRIKTLKKVGAYFVADQNLTSGIMKTVSFWDPDNLRSYSGALWELQPVEVISRTRPLARTAKLEPAELSAFTEAGVDPAAFKNYLKERNLALIVMRNITSRDVADIQQPFNLKVQGSETSAIGKAGKVYTVSHLQIFQGDQIRGYGGTEDSRDGRRVIAQNLHDAINENPAPTTSAPAGSVQVAADGSVAAIVPARRALTWQLTDPDQKGVIRERYWLTFQSGEIRLCGSCHGVNAKDQLGNGAPQNKPEALTSLLRFWANSPHTPGTEPSFTLKVKGKNSKGKLVNNKLLQGNEARLEIAGSAENSGFQSLNLEMSVNNTSCNKVIKSLTTAADGSALLKGKVNRNIPNATLKFSLKNSAGTEKASGKSILGNGKRKKLSKAQLKKVCASLKLK